MEKSICLNCGAAFDQTPGKREKKFCKPSCRVSYCQKKKRKVNSANATKQAKRIVKASLEADKMHEGVLPKKNFKKEIEKIIPKPDQDKHGAGKIVKEAVQKKETKKSPAVSNFLEQRRKQKLG